MSQFYTSSSGGGGSGTVTSFSFTNANGFTGIVTNPTTTPNLTITSDATPNGVFGDGSDGAQTFDGTSTVLGLVPSANVYILTRDIFLSAGTVNSGVFITTAGFKIFCNGTLTNNGTISWNAINAASLTGGSINSGSNTGAIATQGGGGTATGGANGTNATSILFGGIGGTGGTGIVHPGGVGGTSVAQGPRSSPRYLPTAINFYAVTVATTTVSVITYGGGSGGGAGGGDGTTAGSSGGGGGGVVIIASLFIAGTGAIQARGATAANAATGTSPGGGGGGGGGVVIIVSRSIVSNAVAGQTVDANGGQGGQPSGIGSPGTAGSNGNIYYVPS